MGDPLFHLTMSKVLITSTTIDIMDPGLLSFSHVRRLDIAGPRIGGLWHQLTRIQDASFTSASHGYATTVHITMSKLFSHIANHGTIVDNHGDKGFVTITSAPPSAAAASVSVAGVLLVPTS